MRFTLNELSYRDVSGSRSDIYTRSSQLPSFTRSDAPGSIIHTDKTAVYGVLPQNWFVHDTVNHSENFVVPERSARTQGVESFWNQLKRRMQFVIGYKSELKYKVSSSTPTIQFYASTRVKMFSTVWKFSSLMSASLTTAPRRSESVFV